MSKVSEARKNAYKPTFFDDIDVVVSSAKLITFHFEPNKFNPEGSDVVQYEISWQSDDGRELTQSYRLGDAKYITITDDGASFDFAEDAKGLRQDSEFYRLLEELETSGYPTMELDEDKRGLIKGLTGAAFHIKSEPVKDSEGNVKRHKAKDSDREYDTTKIWPTKLLKLPWEKGTASAKKGAAATPKSSAKAAPAEEKAAPADAGDIADKLKGVIVALIGNAKNNVLEKSKVMMAIVQKFAVEDRAAAIGLAQDAAFLGAIDGVKFDGSTLTFE